MVGIRVAPDNNDIIVWKLDEALAPFINSSTSTNALSHAISDLDTLSGTIRLQQPSLFAPNGTNSCVQFTANNNSSPRNFISGANDAEPNYPISISGWVFVRQYDVTSFRFNLICKQHTIGVWSGATFSSMVIQNRRYASLPADWDFYIGTTGTNAGVTIPQSNGITLNIWTHVGITYDGTTTKYYINGNLVQQNANTGNVLYGNGPWFFGAIPSGSGNPEECAISTCDWRIADIVRPQSYFQDIFRKGMMQDVVESSGTGFKTYYKLRAYDLSCSTPTPVYWVSTSANYSGAPTPPCGSLGPIEVIEKWSLFTDLFASSEIGANLSGLAWLLPNIGNINSNTCTTIPTTTLFTTLESDPTLTYDVTLRFRGVVEEKTYTGGSNDGAYFQIGGTPDGGTYNIYSLYVSNPPQTFFLNRGTSGQTRCYSIDYIKTIQMKGNATIVMNAQSIDNQEIRNFDGAATPISISSLTFPTQPYDGQFIIMDVVSVTAA